MNSVLSYQFLGKKAHVYNVAVGLKKITTVLAQNLYHRTKIDKIWGREK